MPNYRLAARRAARKYDVDPNIFLRMIGQESGFDPHARSPAGAQGIAQFMPPTARAYGVNLNDNRVTDDLEGAAKYLRANLDRTGGSYTRALSIYNSGQPEGYKHIAETRNYVRSILGGRTPRASARPASSSGDSGGLASRLEGSVTPGTSTGTGFDPGEAQGLSSLLEQAQPQVAAPVLPAAPFSTSKYLRMGQAPVVNAPSAPESGVEGLLAQIQSPGQGLPEVSTTAAKTSVSGSVDSGPTAHASRAGSGRMPTVRAGKIIGTPNTGTHTLGNWQSDRAVDIAVPAGTPMVALQDGVVEKVRRHPQSSGRFAGDQITIRGANGNEYFYAHGVASVKPGQRIRKGQRLGVTGSANGVEHLHFAQRRGDVFQHVRGR